MLSIGVGAFACLLAIFEIVTPNGLNYHENSPTANKHRVALLDYDNDGLLDIFLVNSGQIKLSCSFARQDPRNWNRLYKQNRDGSFQDVTEAAGLQNDSDENYGMGVSAADHDNDGRLDLFVTRYMEWDLRHSPSVESRRAIRARRFGITQTVAGRGYLSASDKRVHFGLGGAKEADVEIWWPSGGRQRMSNVDVDRFLNVEEPK